MGRFSSRPSSTIDRLLSGNNVPTMDKPLGCMNLEVRGREKNYCWRYLQKFDDIIIKFYTTLSS